MTYKDPTAKLKRKVLTEASGTFVRCDCGAKLKVAHGKAECDYCTRAFKSDGTLLTK